MPTVRRSCHPIPGASGFPVARSQTMLEALWLAMPTASTGPPSRERGLRHGEDGVGHQPGVELHQARRRGVGEDGGVVHMVDRGIGSHEGGTHS